MSFALIYDKQFIKLKDTYLPIVLSGDSNVYDGRKRHKSWCGLNLHGKPMGFYTLNEMLDSANSNLIDLEDSHNDIDVKKNYGYLTALSINGKSCAKTTFRMYRGLLTSGVKNALTIGELKMFGVSLCFNISFNFGRDNNPKYKRFMSPSDETELIEIINYINEARLDNVNYCVSLSGLSIDKDSYTNKRIKDYLAGKNLISYE